MLPCSPLSVSLLLWALGQGAARSLVTSADVREAADNSRRLAAELTVILNRVRAGQDEGDTEDTIRRLNDKIQTLEQELLLSQDSREEEGGAGEEVRKAEDKERKIRIAKFRQMLREFYLGAHYDFSI